MIAGLNLASDPFRNRVLPWTVTAAVACVSLIALIWIVSVSRATEREAARAEASLRELKGQTSEIRERAEALKGEMPAEDLRTLEAAHQLVDRKGFSWSGLLADLEAAVPAGVRVTRIGVRDVVQTTPDATLAELNLAVVGRAPADVTRMIADMNRNGVFIATPLTQEAAGRQGETGIEWTLRVSYRPRPGRPLSPTVGSGASVARLSENAALSRADAGEKR